MRPLLHNVHVVHLATSESKGTKPRPEEGLCQSRSVKHIKNRLRLEEYLPNRKYIISHQSGLINTSEFVKRIENGCGKVYTNESLM